MKDLRNRIIALFEADRHLMDYGYTEQTLISCFHAIKGNLDSMNSRYISYNDKTINDLIVDWIHWEVEYIFIHETE